MSPAKWVVALLLAANSILDLWKREILLKLTIFTGLGGCLWQLLEKGQGGNSLWGLFFSMLPGLLLLGLSKATGGKIGLGDGLVIWAGGIWLDFFAIFQVLLVGLLLAAVFSAFLLVANSGKKEIPFVPFVFAAFLLLAL